MSSPSYMMFVVEGAKSGHFPATRGTPGGPEINHHDLPAQSRQVEVLPTQLLNHERRRCLFNTRAHGVEALPSTRRGGSAMNKSLAAAFKLHVLKNYS
jgi:hypothetical protein